MKLGPLAATAAIVLGSTATGAPVLAPSAQLGVDLQPFVRVPAGRIALAHVRVIDGTGAVALDDRTVLIDGARIAAVQAASAALPAGDPTLHLARASGVPGLLRVHNPPVYPPPPDLHA